MNMQEAMEYLTTEGIRLQAIGVSRSNVVMSTFIEGGDVARLTVTVDLISASELKSSTAPTQSAPQQNRAQQQQQQPMTQPPRAQQ